MKQRGSRTFRSRKWLAVALVCLQLFALCGLAGVSPAFAIQVPFAGGDGSMYDPYLIENAAQLNEVRNNLNSGTYFKLMVDIDLDVASPPFDQGAGWVPIGNAAAPFKGSFNGNGHTVKNLKITVNSGPENLGLFGVTENATVSNFGLLNVNANAPFAAKVGSLIGWAKGTNIMNVFATGSVLGQTNVGGLIGAAENVPYSGGGGFPMPPAQTLLQNAYFKGAVQADTTAGGLIGSSSTSDTNILASYVLATVTTLMGNSTSNGLMPLGSGYVTDSYYASDIAGFNNKGLGTAKTSTELKDNMMYPIYPGSGWIFATGSWGLEGNKNEGYPYLKVFDSAPVALAVTVTGTAKVGQTLTGSYAYQDAEFDTEGTSTFKWYSASNASGASESEISGATSKTYKIAGGYDGKYIRFEVTPKALTGQSTGTAVKSAWYGPVTHPFAGGSGSQTDPWLIETADQLNSVRLYLYPNGHPLQGDKYYKLTADIDLGVAPYNQGAGWEPFGTTGTPFTGGFDGNGHTISNLKIVSSQRVGLFGYIYGGEVKRLGLKNVDVQASTNMAGALLGAGQNLTISEVYATGSVKSESGFAGGLIGYAEGSTTNPVSITDSYFRGDVQGTNFAGGLVGYADNTKLNVARSYAAASIISTYVSLSGGLIASNSGGTGTITSSYYDKDVSGYSDTGKGEPTATADMKLQSTYSGWDFSNAGVWRLDAFKNDGYPYLDYQIFNAAPVAAGVSIGGTAILGRTLTGIYTYSDADNDLEGASLFKWYRSDDAAGANKLAISDATAKTYVLQEADYGKYISFEVTPVALTGVVTGTAVESAKTSAVTEEPLSAPASLGAAAGDRQITLNWGSVTGATYYNIYSGTASHSYNGTPIATVTGTTYQLTGLTNGTTYYFAVKAADQRRVSDYSNETSATPQPTVLTSVGIRSSNPAPAFAKTGDTATVTFTSVAPLTALPAVTIAGQPAVVTSVTGNVYAASLLLGGNISEGLVGFSIEMSANVTVSSTTDGSSLLFDKTAPTGTLSINGGAQNTSSVSVNLTVTGSDGTGSGGLQMRFSNDNVTWSSWEPLAATKAWTLSAGSGAKTVSMELKDAAGNVTLTALSGTITLLYLSGGSSSGGLSLGESITVNVENSGNGGVVSTAVVNRTIGANGLKKDEVSLTSSQTDKLVDQLKTAGSDAAKLVIPDPKDEVSELKVNLPKESTAKLADNQVSLEISTNNVRMLIPDGSLQGWKDDIYFHIVPVKTDKERSEAEQRARTEQLVREAAGTATVNVLGRPMMIETNMQNRPITLILPLKDTGLSGQQLQDLGIFIEHSDGTKELLRGEIVSYDAAGTPGIQFTVNKFSTFTVVNLGSHTGKRHQAYMTGYPDGSFGPDKPMTRAEMATVLVRLFGKDQSGTQAARSYTDIAADHWAKAAVEAAAAGGLMDGYPDGSFKPEKTITRAEIAAIAARLSTAAEGGSGFSDTAGHWAAAAIAKAKAAGIVNGYGDGTFRPEQTLTRAEAVTMLNKLSGREPSSASAVKWSDVPASHWAFKDIAEASADHTHESK
ncbi:S-layer homology domain-containing protein [Paenibacillus thalictri]|uniref:S-layer homology domain-containing protein n=1 Tax=Paenibacillus thalictri TaxID=2527873 RepID=UPI0013EF09F0|nr:S-layer homology domain-containing protein [Paenibacillus thalictri]